MARSEVYMQWTNVRFTYGTTPTVIDLKQVEDVQWDKSSTPVYFSGDAAPGPTHKKCTNKMRTVKLIGADIGALATVPEGVFGTLTATLNDLYNGEAIGALNLTLTNCSCYSNQFSGQHNQVGKGTLEFSGVWGVDGTTGAYVDPLTITEVEA